MKKVSAILLVLILSAAAFAAGEAVRYEVNGAPYEGYYVSPAAKAPLVLLLHDWDGLTDYEVKRAEMLAKIGYSVFAADLFGAGIRPTEIRDKRQHTGELYQDRQKMRTLIQGALNTAKSQGANVDNTVVMGYCFGGAAVLEFARAGADMKGFVTFHGGLGTPQGQDYSKTKGKVLIMHGTADSAISMDQFAQLADDMEAHGVAHEMVTYSATPHAFTVFGGSGYRKEADEKSWMRFVVFLNEVCR